MHRDSVCEHVVTSEVSDCRPFGGGSITGVTHVSATTGSSKGVCCQTIDRNVQKVTGNDNIEVGSELTGNKMGK